MSKLTANEALSLAAVINTAIYGSKVARVAPKGHYAEGDILQGTARSIGDANFNRLSSDTDVRDGFLRVTTRGGMEVAWPIRDLMDENARGEFAAYDW